MWNAVQQNIGKFQRLFGGKNFIVVDNNDAGEDIFEKVWKRCMVLVRKKVSNRIAKSWIAKQLAMKEKGQETTPMGTGKGGGQRQRIAPKDKEKSQRVDLLGSQEEQDNLRLHRSAQFTKFHTNHTLVNHCIYRGIFYA